DQDVLADLGRHQNQAEVERDVTAGRARAPARSLVADRDAVHGQSVPRGERPDLGWKCLRGLPTQLAIHGRRAPSLDCARPLAPGPVHVALGEAKRLRPGATAGNRDAQIAIGPYPHYVAARAAHPYEVDACRLAFFRLKAEA